MPDEATGKKVTHMSVSIVGDMDTPGTEELYSLITQSGCNVEACRTLDMGQMSGVLLQLGGNWDSLARCENLLKRFSEKRSLSTSMARPEAGTEENYSISYSIDIVAKDRPGIIHSVVKFMKENGIMIRNLSTNSYARRASDAVIFTMGAVVRLPSSMTIASFRADFGDLCDHENLDAVVEPIRPYD